MITHSKVGFRFLNIFFRITIHPHAHKSYHLSWSGDEVVPSVASIPILFPSGWWLTYPYEKSWSSSVGIFWHSQYDGKVIQNSMVPNHQPGSLSYVWTHVFHYGARSNGPTANSLRPCHVRHGHGTGWSSRCRSRRCNALGSSAPAPRPRSTWPGGVSSHKWNICRTMYL